MCDSATSGHVCTVSHKLVHTQMYTKKCAAHIRLTIVCNTKCINFFIVTLMFHSFVAFWEARLISLSGC